MGNRVWKSIKGFEGFYEVSNDGLIKSLDREVPYRIVGLKMKIKGKMLTPVKDGYGYPFVVLQKYGYKKTKKVHQLVAETFIEKPGIEYQVNHIDGNKENNFVGNLEYVTPKENTIHAINVLGKVRAKETHWKHKITLFQVEEMRRLYKTGKYSQKDLAEKYGIHRGHLSKICNNKAWIS